MIQVSLAGFLVGGAFVNIGYWDFPFYLAAVAFALAALPVGAPASAPAVGQARPGIRRPVSPMPVAMTRRMHGPR